MTPRGVSHAFTVVSPTARLLSIVTPGSAGAFYYGASEPAGDEAGAVDFDRIRAMAASTGITDVQGPPPFAPGATAGYPRPGAGAVRSALRTPLDDAACPRYALRRRRRR